MQNLERFPHRRNQDGTFDSICPKCFHTVSTQSDESLLIRLEREHVCVLDDFPVSSRPEAAKSLETLKPAPTIPFPLERRSTNQETQTKTSSTDEHRAP